MFTICSLFTVNIVGGNHTGMFVVDHSTESKVARPGNETKLTDTP